PEHRVLHALCRFRATRDRNVASGDSHVYDADLGRVVGVSHSWREVELLARHFAPALHHWIDGAGLSADRVERPDRPCSCPGDGGELGGRSGLFEMGANPPRSEGGRVAGLFMFEGSLHLSPVHPRALWALAFSGLVGSAFAYLLWFEIVRRLPATAASLGVLSVPVVGIVASVLVLGERPTIADIVGSVLILTAAAGVLLAPTARSSQPAPIEQ